MTNQAQNPTRTYDLIEGTSTFEENVIVFILTLLLNVLNRSVVSQIIKSATSIGANYMEADGAESRKDFQHKIGICKKESKETLYRLKMLATANPYHIETCRIL